MGTFEDGTQEGRSKEEPSQEGSSKEGPRQEASRQEGHGQEGSSQEGHGQEGSSQEDHRKEGSSQEGSRQEDSEEGHGQEVASKEEDHHQEVRFLLQLLRGATVIDLPCSCGGGACRSTRTNQNRKATRYRSSIHPGSGNGREFNKSDLYKK